MLTFKTFGSAGPTIFMLHWLGGSADTWTEVGEGLAACGMTCVALDLPGFGCADAPPDFTVQSTVEAVVNTISQLRPGERPWFLAGHSMGGKFASIVARAAIDGNAVLSDLRGIVLVSPSPPGAEPMDDSKRQKLISQFGQDSLNRSAAMKLAETFVDENTGKLPLVEGVRNRAVGDLLRMDRRAFVGWLTTGSKEDWAERVGIISLPVLILAGSEEAALGPGAQRENTLPHFPNAELVTLEGGGHLGPLERPAELVERIAGFIQNCGLKLSPLAVPVDADFRALIDSPRTSPQTRSVLNNRMLQNEAITESTLLTQEELFTLRAIAARVLPGCPFDVTSRVLHALAEPVHDGWRHDSLPPDAEAWRTGTRSINAAALRQHGVPFIALDPGRQDELLEKARDGDLGRGLLTSLLPGRAATLYTAAQMADWFGDVCAELVKTYMADPRVMQHTGFTGFADEHGFSLVSLNDVRLNEREEFER